MLKKVRPVVVLFAASLVAGLAVPAAIWSWMRFHTAFFGAVTVDFHRFGRAELDPKWALPIIGIVSLLAYALISAIALLLARKASRATRNLIAVALLPVFFAGVWLTIASQR